MTVFFRFCMSVTTAALLATLSACGGGGGGGTTDTPTMSPAISGRVADGYINGAIVFWDCNGDGIPNISEIQTTSAAGGQYRISPAPSAQCVLSAYVPVGAIDEDTPDQAISRAYTLVATTDHPEFISPLSTLSHLAARENTNLTAAQAASQAASLLNISGNIHTNYITETDANGLRKHAVAKVLVNVLQSQNTPSAVSDGQAAAYYSITSLAPAISSADFTVPSTIANLIAPFRGFLAQSTPLSFMKDKDLDHYAVRPNSALGLTSAQTSALNEIINLPAVLQATRFGVISWIEIGHDDMVNIVKRMQAVGITGENNAAVQAAKDQAISMRNAFTTYYNEKIKNENKFWGSDVSTNLKFAMDTTFSAVDAVSGAVSATTGLPASDLRPFRESPNIKKGMNAVKKMRNVPDMFIALIKDAEDVLGDDKASVKEALALNDGEALSEAQTAAVLHSLTSVVEVMKEALKKNNLEKAGSLFKGAILVYDSSKVCEEKPGSSECYGKSLEVIEAITESFKLPGINRVKGGVLALRAGFDAYSQGKEYAKETGKQVQIAQDQWDQAWKQAMDSVDKILYVQLFDYGGFEKYFMAYDISGQAMQVLDFQPRALQSGRVQVLRITGTNLPVGTPMDVQVPLCQFGQVQYLSMTSTLHELSCRVDTPQSSQVVVRAQSGGQLLSWRFPVTSALVFGVVSARYYGPNGWAEGTLAEFDPRVSTSSVYNSEIVMNFGNTALDLDGVQVRFDALPGCGTMWLKFLIDDRARYPDTASIPRDNMALGFVGRDVLAGYPSVSSLPQWPMAAGAYLIKFTRQSAYALNWQVMFPNASTLLSSGTVNTSGFLSRTDGYSNLVMASTACGVAGMAITHPTLGRVF